MTTPFPYWHQMGVPPTTSEEELVSRALYQLELILLQQTSPKQTAAIIIEPVIGEGGYVPAPASYLKGLREIADKNEILLIFDEVQCGFGRTGKYFTTDYSGVKPDMLIMAKVRRMSIILGLLSDRHSGHRERVPTQWSCQSTRAD